MLVYESPLIMSLIAVRSQKVRKTSVWLGCCTLIIS